MQVAHNTNTQEIITVKLTTDGVNECRETMDIIVEGSHVELLEGKTLCRKMPSDQLMIVRMADGRFLRRGPSSTVGISLTSFLYGKTGMRRIDPTDVEDYTLSAFKADSGKPESCEIILHKEAFRAVDKLWADQQQTEVVTMAEKSDVDLSKSLKPFTSVTKMSVDEMNAELVDIINRINEAKKIRTTGAKANCPCCGEEFVKSHGIAIFCSSTSRGDKNGCKDALNSRKTELRKAIEERGGEVDPSAAARQTKRSQPKVVKPQTTVEEKPVVETPAETDSEVFKTIGGIPFTLAETKALLMSDADKEDFKEFRGIKFSLSEMRKLILE